MNRRTFLLGSTAAISTTITGASPMRSPIRLKVDPTGHYLVHHDGKPFFYLGDTAWELFHRLSFEDSRTYLANRARKGFTVIQAVALAEFDGLTVPNANGDLPLKDMDPTKPIEAYFHHMDRVIDEANRLGLIVGLLPTWGDKWSKKWGVGPEIFNPQNAEVYGEWLGRRYRNKDIIWILGGDRNPEAPEHFAIIRAMAKGLKAGDGGSHLMTFHPSGSADSSRWFHKDVWLDFNMFQSGHGARFVKNYEFTLKDSLRKPVKPTVDGEPRYEDHPINWKPNDGYFTDADVREAFYWSMLNGAAGHTYGDHNIWQFLSPSSKPISAAHTQWKTAIDHPGSTQVGIGRRLLERAGFQRMAKDESHRAEPSTIPGAEIFAARNPITGFRIIYSGKGLPFRLGDIAGSSVWSWFDPRTGKESSTKSPEKGGEFVPPTSGPGSDWLLIGEHKK